ncbi:MAG: hypothetical protein WEC12_01685 [Balneolaceae bacterium]
MAFAIRKITRQEEIDLFHELPFRIYKEYPRWIPPFRDEIEKIFDREKNPFYRHGECERFLIFEDQRVVGRFALMVNEKKDHLYNPKMGGIGFIEMVNDQKVADAMIDYASVWHNRRGNGAFRGPVNFGENDNYWGLLIENFDEPPVYGMFYHPPWYRELLENTGAEKLDDQWSYKRFFNEPLPERLVKITNRIESRPGVEFRPINFKNIYRDADHIREIYNAAWREQDISEREEDFSELTRETVYDMVKQLKWIMIRDSVLLAFVDGEPASFIVCLPDLNEISAETRGRLRWWHYPKLFRFKKRAKRLRTVVYGTKPKFRKLGLEALTFVRGIQKTKAAAPTLDYLEGAWVSEKNWLMQRSLEALGCFHHKTHRTYRWPTITR